MLGFYAIASVPIADDNPFSITPVAADVVLTGVEATAEVGELVIVVNATGVLTGVVATTELGELNAFGGVALLVEGFQCTVSLGVPFIWAQVAAPATSIWTPI